MSLQTSTTQAVPMHDITTSTLHTKLNIPLKSLSEEYWDLPLTGKHFGLSFIGMTYLFFELEEVVGIRIREEYLYDYGFSTINKVAATLAKVLNEY